MRIILLMVVTMSLPACASGERPPAVASVAEAVDPLALQAISGPQTYQIGPADKLKIAVFQVPDLSFDEIFVDAAGQLQLPLVGSIQAAGATPAELSNNIEALLRSRYLRDPQVTVTVLQAASQKVTVDGAVTKPGVYEMRGRTTLMQAVAMAEGPTRIADLRSVAVFRTQEGRRMVALFDLRAIRNGQAEDPVILGDDTIVVDTSNLSANLQQVLTALPGLAVFAYF